MKSAYQTDLSDAEWGCLEPHLPVPNATGRPKRHTTREILNAIFYVLKSGCAWRLLPNDLEHHGRPSTTTLGDSAWMAPGRGCTPPYASG
jgi:transposase